MEVPGSIPGVRKSLFWGVLGRRFLRFLHIFWHVGGHFGDTFWSGRDHIFVIFGMSWEVPGSGLGTFLDRFWQVVTKMSDGVRKLKLSKWLGVFSLSRGASK